MKSTFRISADDYVRAMKLHARPSRTIVAILVALALFLVGMVAFGSADVADVAIVGIAAGLTVFVLGYIFLPIRSRSHYKKYRAMQDEFTIELVEDGVRYTSSNGQATVPWNNILKWRQNDHYILMYLMPRMFHIVPKSTVADSFDIPALVNELTRHVGNPV